MFMCMHEIQRQEQRTDRINVNARNEIQLNLRRAISVRGRDTRIDVCLNSFLSREFNYTSKINHFHVNRLDLVERW